MPYIDDFLNKITMYRLVLWGLGILAVFVVGLGFSGVLAYGGAGMLLSLAILLCVCYGSNYLFALVWRAPRNIESAYITALILFFILAPVASISDVWWLAAAAAVAMGSKYVLALRKHHIFNPAAVAALAISLAGSDITIWWVATPVLLPAVVVIGLLFVRKLRRFDLFLSFIIVGSAATALYDLYAGVPLWSGFVQHMLSWPFIFVAAVMLTEPLTTPPARAMRIAYGVLVALLCSVPFHIGFVYSSPALALVLGNIFSYAVGPKQRLLLRFVSKKRLSANVYEFAFLPDAPLEFVPGQYLEWTLPHSRPDTRGNRRYFTIASAPGERELKLGVRLAQTPSSFKKALFALEEGATLSAASLAGEFVLPRDPAHKLVCIAGGVGITPFASMLRHLLARGERRDITLVYAASAQEDFAYGELLREAQDKLGLRVVYTTDFVTKEMITKIPGYAERTFYISGPDAMVRTYRRLLRTLHIPEHRLKTDYFPGL